MKKLTEKQERFLQNLDCKGMSQREAYRDAYKNKTMKDSSVDVAASRLLKNAKVLLRREELENEKEGVECFGLTLKEEKFVEALVLGDSQRLAYKKAYNCSRFSDKTVDEKASRLFRRDKVKARYEQLKKRAVSAAENGAVMEFGEMARRLSGMARSNLLDVLEVLRGEEGVVIDLKDGADLSNVREIYLDKCGNLRVKMHDQIRAMEKLVEITRVNAGMDDKKAGSRVKIVIEDNGEGYDA